MRVILYNNMISDTIEIKDVTCLMVGCDDIPDAIPQIALEFKEKKTKYYNTNQYQISEVHENLDKKIKGFVTKKCRNCGNVIRKEYQNCPVCNKNDWIKIIMDER